MGSIDTFTETANASVVSARCVNRRIDCSSPFLSLMNVTCRTCTGCDIMRGTLEEAVVFGWSIEERWTCADVFYMPGVGNLYFM